PVSKIRSASMGMVELNGQAVGPYSVIAPVTDRPCYYFRTLVWEWKRQGRSRQWVKVAAECMHVPFFLDDNTGKIMVDPRGAELDLHRDFQQEFCDSFFTTKEEVPANVRTLLLRHGVNTTNKIKVEEFCIKPKNALFVLGTLGENPGLELSSQPIQDDEHNTLTFAKTLWFNPAQSELGLMGLSFTGSTDGTLTEHRSVSELLIGTGSFPGAEALEAKLQPSPLHRSTLSASAKRIEPPPDSSSPNNPAQTQQQKIATALMKAGITNPAAWAAAGITPSNPSGQANAANATTGFDTRPSVVLMKGKNNPTFLISWRSQREVARSLGWKCALQIWGGPALALLCLYGLLMLTHLI
ncbi:MAG: GIDE domain-containing protein, partial [Candidatus Sulfotelmatobacter sp.]